MLMVLSVGFACADTHPLQALLHHMVPLPHQPAGPAGSVPLLCLHAGYGLLQQDFICCSQYCNQLRQH